jgi:hypothetical protein
MDETHFRIYKLSIKIFLKQSLKNLIHNRMKQQDC